MKKLFLYPFLLLLLVSCSKEESDFVIVQVETNQRKPEKQPSEVVSFKITAEATKHSLKKFTIDRKVKNKFTKQILDSSISRSSFNMNYERQVANFDKKTEVLFIFKFTDSKGNTGKGLKEVIVTPVDTSLNETSGHQFFSRKSDEHDAYSIVNGKPLFSFVSDSSDIDVTDTSTTDSLSRVWVSPAGGKFVRFNGFDYANATNQSLINSYKSGTKYDFLPSVKEGDIILYHREDLQFYAAIKLLIVREKKGSKDDSYIFSIKK